MNPPDRTFRELAGLYDFCKELRKYRIKDASMTKRTARRTRSPRPAAPALSLPRPRGSRR